MLRNWNAISYMYATLFSAWFTAGYVFSALTGAAFGVIASRATVIVGAAAILVTAGLFFMSKLLQRDWKKLAEQNAGRVWQAQLKFDAEMRQRCIDYDHLHFALVEGLTLARELEASDREARIDAAIISLAALRNGDVFLRYATELKEMGADDDARAFSIVAEGDQ